MKKFALLLCVCFVSIFAVKSQTLPDKLKAAFSKFSSDEQLKYASASLTILNSQTGKIIFSTNDQTGLVPASTLKTITAATALGVLGEEERFKTQITYSGTIINGILNGDLIIRGSGDPTLGSDRFISTKKAVVLNKILNEVKAAGIHKIEGSIVADDAIWESQSLPQGWIWQDIGNYYGAQTSAICWGENEFELNFTPSKTVGAPAAIRLGEFIYPFINIKNELKTGAAGSGDNVYGYSAPYQSEVFIRGTYGIDLKKTIRFSLPHPALAMAYDLFNILDKNGISAKAYTISSLSNDYSSLKDAKILLTISSPALKEMIYHFNQKSINLYGEQLVRMLAQKGGAPIAAGLDFIQNYWDAKDIDKRSLNIIDGSGLSPANRVTTGSMANILYQSKSQTWFPAYYESFPFNNGMKMKSGTIGDVLAYAGYHNGYCFAIIVNNYNGSAAQLRQKLFTLLNHLK